MTIWQRLFPYRPTCCVRARKGWEVCPVCGEDYDWEDPKAKQARLAAQHIEHEHKMATDTNYASHQRFMDKCFEHGIHNHLAQADSFWGLLGGGVILTKEGKE